ncbi:MAG: GNAT family N-acetyltransferase [Pseudomonadota bacterium]
MTCTLVDMPREDRAWLHQHFAPYFRELVPDLPIPTPERNDRYWDDPDGHPLLILQGRARAGFALVHKDRARFELAEFAILPPMRRHGLGAEAVDLALQRFPGPWVIGVASRSGSAAPFWAKILKRNPFVQGLQEGPSLTPYQSPSYTFTYQGTSDD